MLPQNGWSPLANLQGQEMAPQMPQNSAVQTPTETSTVTE
jgi:hypothetical protein